MVIALISMVAVAAMTVTVWLTIGFSVAASLPKSQANIAAEIQIFLLPLSVLLGLIGGVIAAFLRRPASLIGRWIVVVAVLSVLGLALNVATQILA